MNFSNLYIVKGIERYYISMIDDPNDRLITLPINS